MANAVGRGQRIKYKHGDATAFSRHRNEMTKKKKKKKTELDNSISSKQERQTKRGQNKQTMNCKQKKSS